VYTVPMHSQTLRIKRFFSGVHACVHGADALIINVLGRLCKVCECIGFFSGVHACVHGANVLIINVQRTLSFHRTSCC
jgi:predicted transcriptional regulator